MHTPGHKNNLQHFPKDFWNLDFTELPDTDSLFEADGAIALAEENACKVFGTAGTLFSAGGCTLCIQTMISLCCKRGSKIIISRNIHRSAINIMALLDLRPIWVLPKSEPNSFLSGRIQAKDVEKAIIDNISDNDKIGAVYITSPTYYGEISNIKSISAVCKKYDIPLLVDNAHGTHLLLTKENLHPISLGATMTACSAHKTLPVLTGGAFLNIADKKYLPYAKENMSIFGSTSPSYLTMASLDLAVAYMQDKGKYDFQRLENRVLQIKDIAINRGITIPNGLCDTTRIALNTASIGINGNLAGEYFRNNGIEPEFTDNVWVVFIPTPFNTDEELTKLENAIKNIPINSPIINKPIDISISKQVMTPSQAFFSKKEIIPISMANGRISAISACPCPPGIPIIFMGELITEKEINLLINNNINHISVVAE